ncbi:hypothetical protein DPJ21_24520, partial [Salmonella enterica subsp. enterica]|nr:hypothetical protein [Salmonella enterica subsp. enterica serovar Kisangani]EBV5179248.1 hypothetical protein [Salmonella enterica subsp. enterica serovar Carmel]
NKIKQILLQEIKEVLHDKKYCILLCSVMLFSFNSYGANTYAYLWVTDKNASGDLSYTGSALTNIIGALDSLYTGTMRIAYVDCSTVAKNMFVIAV